MIWNFIISVALTAASSLHSRNRRRQLERKMDAAKGFEAKVRSESTYLPIVYGRQKIEAIPTFHKTANNWKTGSSINFGSIRTPATGYRNNASNYMEFVKVSGYPVYRLAVVRWNGVNVFSEVHLVAGTPSFTRMFSSVVRLAAEPEKYLRVNQAKIEDEVFGVNGDFYGMSYDPAVNTPATVTYNIPHYDSSGNLVRTEPLVVERIRVGISKTTVPDNQYFNKSNVKNDTNGDKNTFLIMQAALALGGINRVVDIEVDGKNWDDESLKHGQEIRVYQGGNFVCPMATANGAPNTNWFTDAAYASMMFRLNRDEYNYNGIPQVSFYVEGRPVRSVLYNPINNDYSLSTAYTFTDNNALILLDYLLLKHGRNLDVSQVDLKSFYEAAQKINTVVMDNVPTTGRMYGHRPLEEGAEGVQGSSNISIRRASANLTLDSGAKIRDNIDLILETMPNANLVWSEGKYKLQFIYPASLEEQSALIVATYNPDDIIRSDVELGWADNSETYNQVTVNFKNVEEDFESDSATWPPQFTSTGALNPVHQTYLAEDGNIKLAGTFSFEGIINKHHALAMAEQICRESRRYHSISITVSPRSLVL